MEISSSPTKTLETDIIQENPIEEQQLESPRRSMRRRKLIGEDDEEETPDQSQGEEEETAPVPSKGTVSSSSKKRVERSESRLTGWTTIGVKQGNILNEKTLNGLGLSVQEGVLIQGRMASSSSGKRKMPKLDLEEDDDVILDNPVPKPEEPKPKRRKHIATKPKPSVPLRVRKSTRRKIAPVPVPSNEDSPLVLSDNEEQVPYILKEPIPPPTPKLSVPFTKIPSISPSSFFVPSSFEQLKDEIKGPNPFASTSTTLPPTPPFLPPIYHPSPSVSIPGTDEPSTQTSPVPSQHPPSASSSKGKEQENPDDTNWVNEVCLPAQHMIKFCNHLHWTLDAKTDTMLSLMKKLSDTVVAQQQKMETMARTLEELKEQVELHHGVVMKKLEDVVEEEVVEEHHSPSVS
uniref:Uncharacterized protein n=1 Tax=Beta vulgaris TaxID=161934 RepID=Q0PEL7_BETVU|nr:hypothetical protein [Beta vulgaris]ABM55239.1 hypothetical protein [Beta vulgaris]